MKRIFMIIACLLIGSDIFTAYIDTQIPSLSASSVGIRTRIFTPDSTRYVSGAPVIIFLQGGNAVDNIDTSSRFTRFGFIVITFNYPGGTGSGGIYDNRGPNCILALKDIIGFATGVTADYLGRRLDVITNPRIPAYGNVGVLGSSNGGNISIVTAGMYGSGLNLAWISNWESPVGEEMPGSELGRRGNSNGNPYFNRAYNDTTGIVDYSKLRYSDTVSLYHESSVFHGGFYYDINGDNVPNRGTDFIINGFWVVNNSVLKGMVSARLLREAVNRSIYPAVPPSHLPSLIEAEEYWRCRTGDVWIDSVKAKLPDLMFMVTASDSDHIQSQKDHPHVLNQYERFRAAGQRFVRLNPDRIYVEYTSGQSQPLAPDNNSFEYFDHLTIRTGFMPETVSDLHYQSASICELADRTCSGNVSNNLNQLAICSTIGISTGNSQLPDKYSLSQNYPNPFNPATKIQFSIMPNAKAQMSKVELVVYDILGRTVAELVNDRFAAGTYSYEWDASNYPSGIYFYELKTEGFTQTKKMALIK